MIACPSARLPPRPARLVGCDCLNICSKKYELLALFLTGISRLISVRKQPKTLKIACQTAFWQLSGSEFGCQQGVFEVFQAIFRFKNAIQLNIKMYKQLSFFARLFVCQSSALRGKGRQADCLGLQNRALQMAIRHCGLLANPQGSRLALARAALNMPAPTEPRGHRLCAGIYAARGTGTNPAMSCLCSWMLGGGASAGGGQTTASAGRRRW